MSTTKIIQIVSRSEFNELILAHDSKVLISPHALIHLSLAQRVAFDEKHLKKILLKEKPRGIGLQRNGLYAAFYRRKRGFIKLIIKITHSKLEIITFIATDIITSLKKIKTETYIFKCKRKRGI